MNQGRGGKGRGQGGGGRGRRNPTPTRRLSTPGRVPDQRGRGRTGASPAGRDRGGLGGEQVEGVRAVRELLVAGRRRTREVLVSTDRDDSPVLEDIRELAAQLNVPVNEVGRSKLAAVARTTAHQGVVARAAPVEELELEDLIADRTRGAPFLLACDGITDPGNLGALLRTAECAGVTGVVLPRHRSVHITPAVTKSAAGAVEHLRFALVGGLPAALARASEQGVLVIGLDMDGETSVHALPPVDGPVMVVLGAEGRGLGRLTRQRCEVVASVPMLGAIESLNVSVAGALALYEVVRQRR